MEAPLCTYGWGRATELLIILKGEKVPMRFLEKKPRRGCPGGGVHKRGVEYVLGLYQSERWLRISEDVQDELRTVR